MSGGIRLIMGRGDTDRREGDISRLRRARYTNVGNWDGQKGELR